MFLENFLKNNIILLFTIISFGKLIERIKIGKFSLGPASVFLVAAFFGYYGYRVSADFKNFGLAIFVYCIGIETGPLFFSSFRKKEYNWSIITIFQLFLYISITFISYFIFKDIFSKEIFMGLYTGSLACTPALATIMERVNSSELGAAFAMIYPFSLIGNIYLITALPHIFRHNIEKLKKEHHEEIMKLNPERTKKFYKITNKNIVNKKFSEIHKYINSEAVFSRCINEDGSEFLIKDDTILNENSLIAAVGTESELEGLEVIIGESVNPDSSSYEIKQSLITRKVIISNQEVAGTMIKDLKLDEKYNIKLTRVIRGGIELSPTPERQIILGDRVIIFGNESDIKNATSLLGNDVEEIFKTQFAPLSIGIILGIIIGLIPIPYLKFPLGFTGGILIVSMYLGYKVKTAGILWQIPIQTTNFLKQLSLSIFFAAVGSNTNFSVLFKSGNYLLLILIILCITYIPVILTYFFFTFIIKWNPLKVLGTVSGNVGNSSVIISVNEKFKTDIPNSNFALSYPLSMIITILSSQLIIFLFSLI